MAIITPQRRREILLDARRQRISQDPFANERLDDFERNLELRSNSNRVVKIKQHFDTKLIYYNGQLYRNVLKDKLNIWKKLIAAGLQVEPILEVIKNSNKELFNRVKPRKNESIVKSKIVGNTLHEFLHKNPNLSLANRLSIAKQIINTILGVWKLGYSHNHPYSINWTITYENGQPKVYLIDFKWVSKHNFIEEQLGEDFVRTAQTIFFLLDYGKHNYEIKYYKLLLNYLQASKELILIKKK